ncbi:MAG: hypothetical protein WBW32_20485 [Luteibacter sp.]
MNRSNRKIVSRAVANTTVGESGQVILMKDSGPTIQCPEEIRIPAQI